MTPLEIRPIRPEDRAALAEAFEHLSAESRYRRFLGPKPALSPRELTYLTEVDHVGHEAYVAFAPDGALIGVARYALWTGRSDVGEFAVTVADAWQHQGLGTVLARRVIAAARANDLDSLTASTFWENLPSRRLLRRVGFRAAGGDGAVLEFRLDLQQDVALAA